MDRVRVGGARGEPVPVPQDRRRNPAPGVDPRSQSGPASVPTLSLRSSLVRSPRRVLPGTEGLRALGARAGQTGGGLVRPHFLGHRSRAFPPPPSLLHLQGDGRGPHPSVAQEGEGARAPFTRRGGAVRSPSLSTAARRYHGGHGTPVPSPVGPACGRHGGLPGPPAPAPLGLTPCSGAARGCEPTRGLCSPHLQGRNPLQVLDVWALLVELWGFPGSADGGSCVDRGPAT